MSDMKKNTKVKKHKERWLLTRKTWKYMTDAGRKLIPDNISGHKTEDVAKIEKSFQDVCDKEYRFLVWRKSSLPGSTRRKSLKKCGDTVRILSKSNWDKSQNMFVSGGRYDYNKVKNDLMMLKNRQDLISEYLKFRNEDHEEDTDLVDKIESYLSTARKYTNPLSINDQTSLVETLNRYFGKSSNRQKIISDILTDRRLLEHLYFKLRKTRNFQSRVKNKKWLRDNDRDHDYGPELESKCLPEIEVDSSITDKKIQTDRITFAQITELQKEYNDKILILKKNEQKTTTTLDCDDFSPSVSETIKRYLKMAKKKNPETDKKSEHFNTINYDNTLKDIHGKYVNRETQTNDNWVLDMPHFSVNEPDINSSDVESSTAADDADVYFPRSHSTPSSPPNSSFGNFLQKLNPYSSSKSTFQNNDNDIAMKKSKSSSNIVVSPATSANQNKTLARKFFKNRSKSQTRIPLIQSFWTPQSPCIWYNGISGKAVKLRDKNLIQLNGAERKTLQKIALSKLQSLNLNVPVKIPSDINTIKTKRRSYLIKKKSLNDLNKDANGLVFGIPLNQCIENDRLLRTSRANSLNVDESLLNKNHLFENDENDLTDSLSTLQSENSSMSNLDDNDHLEVPSLITACIKHLRNNSLHTVGIFRVSSSKRRVKQLRDAYDTGQDISWDNEQCPHDIATLLKEYLRDLPDPLLCRDLYQSFQQTQNIRNRKQQLSAIQYLVHLLPLSNINTLWTLLSFLVDVIKNSEDQISESGEIILGNKMDSYNLAAVFAPNILHNHKTGQQNAKTEKPEEGKSIINVIKTMIDFCDVIFEVPADLVNEIYLEMMETNPQSLNQLLNEFEFYESEMSSESIKDTLQQETTERSPEKNVDKVQISSGRNSIFSRIRGVGKDLNMSAKSKLLKMRSASIDGSVKLTSDRNNNLADIRRQSLPFEMKENIPIIHESTKSLIDSKMSQIEYIDAVEKKSPQRDYNASISNIGPAVMKSKTAEFETMNKITESEADQGANKKLYNRRKYTNHRHPTTIIPEIKDDNIEKPGNHLFKRQQIIASSRNK